VFSSFMKTDRLTDLQLEADTPPASAPTHVVSALPLPTLSDMLPAPAALPAINTTLASSVTVLNLVFPPTAEPVHPPGFGYLIPRPADGYASARSPLLGVVFDSCALTGQDRGAPGFTKLTVMLGGPYPVARAQLSVPRVLDALREQLGTALPEPVHVAVHDHATCIPAPAPGHLGRVARLREVLASPQWGGRLEVVGAGVGGVSVGDCVRQGREAGMHWA
jgi:oxygen-dependent protoporphyrinogen oxidase